MLACKHDRAPFGAPLCDHLIAGREPWISYVRWLVGKALEWELLCVPCADQRTEGSVIPVDRVCEECFERATEEVGDLTGVRGAPGISERAEPFDDTLLRSALPGEFGAIADIAPLDGLARSVWLLLAEDGRLIRFDADTLDHTVVASSSLPVEPDRKPFMGHSLRRRLHVSSRGEFAAVVNDYGRYGQVLDLRSGRVSLALDGGDCHPETVPFSFAFVDLDGRAHAIHRTDGNRLDVSDPATGRLLTSRGPTRYGTGEQRPPHFLDYYHGALHLSPKGSRVLDDGWIWHPVGVPTTWRIEPWILHNPWESEDGPTKLDTCARDYYWDHAFAWLDETKIAVGGIGDDDIAMIDGVRVFDVSIRDSAEPPRRAEKTVAREIASFPGPTGRFFGTGPTLFSSDVTGLSRWDIKAAARTGLLASFRPSHHHRGVGELVQVVDRELVRWAV